MLWTLIGIVVLAVLMLIFAGAEHIEKKTQDNPKTITKRKMDGLQDIKDHEDHLES